MLSFCDEISNRHEWIVIDEHISSSDLASPPFQPSSGGDIDSSMIMTYEPNVSSGCELSMILLTIRDWTTGANPFFLL